jgi:uncharacterized protein YqjF (DUF2071 family)
VTRPRPGPFLTARWLHLAMANWQVDPAILRDLVPPGTALGLWRGQCFVSVVGFQFLDTRVRGMPIPFHRDFEEVNLRFYVERLVDGAARRGVVFIKEIVPRRAIAWIANRLYNEKYVALPMSHDHHLTSSPRTVAYSWQYHGKPSRLGVTLEGEAYLPDPDSEEAFITEHYWGYTAQRDGSTLEYQVEHPRWNVWKGTNPELVCDVAALYGPRFASALAGPPSSCFVADGSDIVVRRGRRVE